MMLLCREFIAKRYHLECKSNDNAPPILTWNRQTTPKQTNGSDCGIFAIKVTNYMCDPRVCIATAELFA